MAALCGLHVPHLYAILFAYLMVTMCCPSTQVTISRHREVTGDSTQGGGTRPDGHSANMPGHGASAKRTLAFPRRHHTFPDKAPKQHGRHPSLVSGNDVPSGSGRLEDLGAHNPSYLSYPAAVDVVSHPEGARETVVMGKGIETGIPAENPQEDRTAGEEERGQTGIDGHVLTEATYRPKESPSRGDTPLATERVQDVDTGEEAYSRPVDEGQTVVSTTSSERNEESEGSYPWSSESSMGDPVRTCEKCHKARQEELLEAYDPNALVQLRIETIKRLILDKLRMEQPPQINVSTINIPAPLSEGVFIDEVENSQKVSNHVKHVMPGEVYDADEDYYGKTTRVIVAANDERPPCPVTSTPGSCFEFNISSVVRSRIATAELWVYWTGDQESSTRNHTLVLSQQTRHAFRTTRTIATHSLPPSQPAGWQAIDIKHAVRRWRSHSYHDQVVRVECPTCESNALLPLALHSRFRPFIVILVTDEPRTRKRRNVNCGVNTTGCCRQDFHLRFLDIGWDWIISPRGFDANYCRGSCADFNSPSFTHTSILQTLRSSSPDVNIPRPCCSPRTSGPVSMIYIDDQGKFLTADLPNMSILSCGCS